MRLDQITRKEVAARLNFLATVGITKPSAVVAQSARMSLLDLFRLAVAEGHIEVNPVSGTDQPMGPKKAAKLKQQQGRERILSNDELVALWRASGDDDYGRITRLAILLGGCRQEIGGMRWSEIGDDGVWTLPATRAKNGKALVLPLPPAALEIIRSVPRHEDRDHVFGGRSVDGFTSWSAAKRALDARLPITPWVFHDLRRTLITGMEEELLLDDRVIKAIVNHAKEHNITNKHYNRAKHLQRAGEALRRWADYVTGLVSGKVVSLRAA